MPLRVQNRRQSLYWKISTPNDIVFIERSGSYMPQEKTYAQVLNEALKEEMRRDKTIFLLGEDIGLQGGAFGVTQGLLKEFGPERVRETPISELLIAGAGVGAALDGYRPIVEIMYIDFFTLAMDQIVNQAAKMRYMTGGKVKVPLVIRTQGGGGRGSAAQHSQSLEAWFVHIPGLKVVMPSTPYDAKGLLKTAICDDNPVIFIEHKLLYPLKGPVPDKEYNIPLGQADIKRKGKDITIIATSFMVHQALSAAKNLEKEGIDAEVIDPRSLVPLDEEILVNSAKKTGRVVVVHEACKRCGIGAEIASLIMEEAFDFLDGPVVRVAGVDTPIPYNMTLEKLARPDGKDIVEAVKKILS